MFWIFLISSAVIMLLCFILLLRHWNKGGDNDEIIELNAEALRNPINSGITVAGIMIPILASLISYLYIKHHLFLNELPALYVCIVLFLFSITVGLFNNYSLATLTRKDGSFSITKKNNISFPSFLVTQLIALFLGLFFLFYFSFFELPKKINLQTNISEYSVDNIKVKEEKSKTIK